MPDLQEITSRLFVLSQYLLPQHPLSRLTGWLAASQLTWLKNGLISLFIRQFDVDMTEALESEPRAYDCFNSFFTRALAEGARPLPEDSRALLNPADGAVSQIGDISSGRVFQAKGQHFDVAELLGGSSRRDQVFEHGHFATIYLSPRDYHRVHMPIDGELTATTYIPGKLFSVNTATAARVPRLFARNERLVCHFDTPAGPMALVMVGAMIVAGIETVWGGQIAPPPRTPVNRLYGGAPDTVKLARGDELGRFMLGSTVILLFPRDAVSFNSELEAGSAVKVGSAMGTIC